MLEWSLVKNVSLSSINKKIYYCSSDRLNTILCMKLCQINEGFLEWSINHIRKYFPSTQQQTIIASPKKKLTA